LHRITAQRELQWSEVAHISLGQAHVHWHITVFSLLMKHQNVPLEFLTHFANHLNQEQSRLQEVLETLPTPHDFFWSWQLTHAHAENSLVEDWVVVVLLFKLDAIWESYPVP
jgi:hypothetical protein